METKTHKTPNNTKRARLDKIQTMTNSHDLSASCMIRSLSSAAEKLTVQIKINDFTE